MHIARQTPQELVVVSGTRWLSVGCAGAAALNTYFAIIHHAPKPAFLVTVFLLVCAAVMDLRKIFTFDGMQRVVRWKGRTILKKQSGEIRFDEIVDIDTQQTVTTTRDGQPVPIYRLAIVTAQATIPMAYTYNGQPDHYSALRMKILNFVKTGSTS